MVGLRLGERRLRLVELLLARRAALVERLHAPDLLAGIVQRRQLLRPRRLLAAHRGALLRRVDLHQRRARRHPVARLDEDAGEDALHLRLHVGRVPRLERRHVLGGIAQPGLGDGHDRHRHRHRSAAGAAGAARRAPMPAGAAAASGQQGGNHQPRQQRHGPRRAPNSLSKVHRDSIPARDLTRDAHDVRDARCGPGARRAAPSPPSAPSLGTTPTAPVVGIPVVRRRTIQGLAGSRTPAARSSQRRARRRRGGAPHPRYARRRGLLHRTDRSAAPGQNAAVSPKLRMMPAGFS